MGGRWSGRQTDGRWSDWNEAPASLNLPQGRAATRCCCLSLSLSLHPSASPPQPLKRLHSAAARPNVPNVLRPPGQNNNSLINRCLFVCRRPLSPGFPPRTCSFGPLPLIIGSPHSSTSSSVLGGFRILVTIQASHTDGC